MFDSFNRRINYLRISVTDRCNLRCTYCMPESGIKLISHKDVLRFAEIVEVAKVAVSMGVDKIRITGGEPLVRKGIVDLISEIAIIKGVKDLAMTTNGILLPTFSGDLKSAGLHRVNISLDTLDPEKFKQITRVGNLADVLKGIKAAEEAGLIPIKINCVIKKSSKEPDAVSVREFCERNGYKVRFIREMDLEHGIFSVVEGGTGGNCKICNRLRLTANGDIKPCLFSDSGYNVRKLGARKALEMAVQNKPFSGSENHTGLFHNIGG